MFRRSRAVTFDPYGRGRSGRRFPRWLLLLLVGLAAGAGGVIYVQERHLPPRLTVDASARLRTAFEQADGERARLDTALAQATRELAAARASNEKLTRDLVASHQTVIGLEDDLAAVVQVLPPDPREGRVEVRAGRFSVNGRQLAYDVVLSRDPVRGRPLSAVVQLMVKGASARSDGITVTGEPIAVSMLDHGVVRGSVALPEGFTPNQTTIRVLDGSAAGALLGMRIFQVRSMRTPTPP